MATLAAVVANTVPRRKGARPFQPRDFLPDRERRARAERPDPDRMLRLVEATNRALGGRDLRPRIPEATR